MNLGGLSAAYGGFQQAENTQATTEQNQAAAKEAAFKLLGAQVLGRALTGGMQPQGPQPPAPGQPSVPAAPPPQSFQQAPPQGGPSPAPAPRPAAGPAGAPPAQGGSGLPEMSLQTLTAQIMRTSPGVRNHPEVLLAALERAAPILDRQSREDLAEMRKTLQTERLAQTGALAKERLEALREAERGRQGRFDTAEARRAKFAESREGQAIAKLDMARQALENRIATAKTREERERLALELRTNHQRATEILSASNPMTGMPEEDRKPFLAQRAQQIEEAITRLRAGGQPAATAPAVAPVPAPASSAPAVAPATANAPPLAMLKPNTITTFANGQKWKIGAGGEPERVP